MKLWIFNVTCGLLLAALAAVLLHWHHVPSGNLPPEQAEPGDKIVSVAAAPAPGGAIYSPPPPPPGAEKALSIEEFRALSVEMMKGLPTRGELQRQRVREGFLASMPVLESAKKIERLASATRGEPALEAEAVLIFQDCVTSDAYLEFVRALCYSSFRALSRKAHRPVRASMAPQAIRALADQLEN